MIHFENNTIRSKGYNRNSPCTRSCEQLLNIYDYASRISYRLLLSNQTRSTNAYEFVNCKLNYTHTRVESYKHQVEILSNDRPDSGNAHRFLPRCWLGSVLKQLLIISSITLHIDRDETINTQSRRTDCSLRRDDNIELSSLLQDAGVSKWDDT